MPDPITGPAELLGEPVTALEPCRWGFTNETALATLESGRRVIVQRVARPERAALLARLTSELPAIVARYGICAPTLLAADLGQAPPLLVRSYIPGETANMVLGEPGGAARVAALMGAQMARLARVAELPAWLDATWSRPDALAQRAQGWLAACAPLLTADAQRALALTIAGLPDGWLGGAVLAHGDLCPVNAILADGDLVGLIDWELARVASPCFDAARWGWVVRYHHPARWELAWPTLLEAAGLPPPAQVARHITALQRLHCLELAADLVGTPGAAFWADRLTQTLAWDG